MVVEAMDRPLRIAGLASSNRRGSLNRRVLDRALVAVEAIEGTPVETDRIDLRSHPLPLYDADQHGRDGIPASARAIHDQVAAADALLVANPEYNGGYPALFKNVVDWVSRIDMFAFHPRYVGLLSASPGKGGGRRGIEHTRALFTNIFVTTHPQAFSLPGADHAFADGEWADAALADRMADWADGFVAAAVAHVEDASAAA